MPTVATRVQPYLHKLAAYYQNADMFQLNMAIIRKLSSQCISLLKFVFILKFEKINAITHCYLIIQAS